MKSTSFSLATYNGKRSATSMSRTYKDLHESKNNVLDQKKKKKKLENI